MNRFVVATLLGAVSIMMLAGLSQGGKPAFTQVAALPLPAISPDAPRAEIPRECDNAANITTACIY